MHGRVLMDLADQPFPKGFHLLRIRLRSQGTAGYLLSYLVDRLKKRIPHHCYVDAMDYYGCWKLFDGLCDAAFKGKNRQFALGGTTQQKYMGKWSDGKEVVKIEVLKKP